MTHFKALPDDCLVLNAARGMHRRGSSHQRAAAGTFICIDVSSPEPAAEDSLHSLPNVMYTSHIAGPATRAMGTLAVNDVAAVLRGESPRDVITPDMLARSAWGYFTMTTFSIFPKLPQQLSAEDLGSRLHDCGLDACNLVVRAGYWCSEDDLKESVPRFTKAMNHAGLQCDFATWAVAPEQFLNYEEQLRILWIGIQGFRMGYLQQRPGKAMPRHRSRPRYLQRIAELCQRVGIRRCTSSSWIFADQPRERRPRLCGSAS